MLRNRQERLARVAIKHKHMPGLGDLRNDIMCLSVTPDRVETGLSGYVVVPHIVMHDLIRPVYLARLCIERHHRIRITIVTRPQTTEKIRTGARRGNENEATFVID